MFGFYLLAFGAVFGLLYIPYAEWVYLDRVHIRVVLFCVVGAGLILWSILPRLDRFEAPGPELTEAAHPELFTVLREIAATTEQEMPREVYLVPELNAFVTLRGGVMGIGSRRVMGLGLPLLQVLSVMQLRAVLAHEFGHYYGGDTALGPWVYKTRAAIARTVMQLSEHSSMLSKPFQLYGLLFLRLTLRVSRMQELSADALAARTVGSRPLAEGLKVLSGAGAVYEPYLASEVFPALKAGYRPPLAQGFNEFLAAGHIASGIRAVIDAEMIAGETDPYDSHPPLRERLAALSQMAYDEVSDTSPPAVSLLSDLDSNEAGLIEFMLSDYARKGFQPISWDELPAIVWIPAWRERANSRKEWLKGLTPVSIGELAKDSSFLAVRLRLAAYDRVTNEHHRQEAAAVFGAALALALFNRDWQLTARPGEPVLLESNGIVIRPFAIPEDLSSGALSRDDWIALTQSAGIADLDLGRDLFESK
jgi:Zn-dependent protease with chaperone function